VECVLSVQFFKGKNEEYVLAFFLVEVFLGELFVYLIGV
jgi:hypothetical protein